MKQRSESKIDMKYWAFFIAKLVIAAGLMKLGWLAVIATVRPATFARDLPWTSALLVYWLFCAGLVYLAVLDQRYRCRTCLRRLRMPVSTGSWTHILLLGPPRTEYICTYGHGTLKVPDLQISGHEPIDWESHDDMWTELASFGEPRR